MNNAHSVVECCLTCEYVLKSEREIDSHVCGRNPPTGNAVVIPSPRGFEIQVVCFRPKVEKGGWCAEFSLSEDALDFTAQGVGGSGVIHG